MILKIPHSKNSSCSGFMNLVTKKLFCFFKTLQTVQENIIGKINN